MSTPIRILALATNPSDGASTRFRLVQWAPLLGRAGFSLAVDAFYPETATPVIYGRGRPLAKLAHIARGAVRRARVVRRAARTADILLIHREAFPLGFQIGLDAIRAFPGAVVYDYDDAMFLPQRQGRGLLGRLERTDTPAQVIARSHLVLAGSRYLAEYAAWYARHVTVFPTSVDTERFSPALRRPLADGCVVGWIGSHSTSKYLEALAPVLARVHATHPFSFYAVGNATPLAAGRVPVRQAAWSVAREAQDFASCDVGVYPMFDDDWARGKCGFKAIQFMASGVPVVAAAVGANLDIIDDGVNGFLAKTEDEWVEKLGWLVADPALREKMGQAGRRTIEERYSVNANGPRLVSELLGALARVRGGA